MRDSNMQIAKEWNLLYYSLNNNYAGVKKINRGFK